MERKNLWAPWRMGYLRGLSDDAPSQTEADNEKEDGGGCFLCSYLSQPEQDEKNFVLWRASESVVVLNRFPYNNGHLLIAPVRHIADLESATESEMLEMTKLIRESCRALSLAISPQGFNVGMNFGRCAGAGLPEHLHIHLVPRWSGDTNFMPVCSDTGVISQSMNELFGLLKKVSREHDLPHL